MRDKMQLPSDWRLEQLGKTAKRGADNFVDGDWIEAPYITDNGIRLIQTGNIGIGQFIERDSHQKFISPQSFKQLSCRWVYPGDVLICRLADPIGRACVVPEHIGESVTAVDCTIYRPEPHTTERSYMLHWLNSRQNLAKAEDVAGGSTRQRISRGNLGKLPVLLPPLPEQRRIAEILDTVDEAIRKTEQLIAKLRQMKQGLLHDLLTRGIDDNGELRDPTRHPEQFKDSPLGRIPKGWEVSCCRDALELASGSAKTKKDLAAEGGGDIPVYGGNGITGYTKKPISTNPTVVIGRVGEYCGTVHLVLIPAWVTDNALYAKHISSKWEVQYLYHFLQWYDPRQTQSRTGQPLVTQTGIGKIPIICPSIFEQRAITEAIRMYETRLESEKSHFTKFKFLKKGLMEDLLTGRVRVNVEEATP